MGGRSAWGWGLWLLCGSLAVAQSTTKAAAYQHWETAGYQAFYSLDYAAALADFARLVQLEPRNPAAWNHLAQARLYREMYRVGALAAGLYAKSDGFLHTRLLPLDPRACRAFLAADRRAEMLARRQLARHPDGAAANYAMAAAIGLRGTYDFALRRAYLAALRDSIRANRYARRAARARGNWAGPQLILGVHDYVAGSLPWTVRWLAHWAGLRGTRRQGIARIRRVARSSAPERVEARILLAVVYRRQGWNRRAARWLRRLRAAYPRNALFALELARAEAAAGRRRRALRAYGWLLAASRGHAPSFARLPWPRIWRAIGAVQLSLRRWHAALAAFLQVPRIASASPAERQQAALAAGEAEDLIGRRRAALADYRRCIALGGAAPAAKAARHWLRHPYVSGGKSR